MRDIAVYCVALCADASKHTGNIRIFVEHGWVIYTLWGVGVHLAYGQFLRVYPLAEMNSVGVRNSAEISRRQLLQRSLASSAISITAFSTAGRWLLNKQQKEITRFIDPITFPATLNAKLYSMLDNAPFPEMSNQRFQPAQHPFGVCFSGGGLRAYSAGVGQ